MGTNEDKVRVCAAQTTIVRFTPHQSLRAAAASVVPAEANMAHPHPLVRCAVYDRAFPGSGKRSKTFQFAQGTARAGGTTGSSEKLRFHCPCGGEETANTSGLDLGVEVQRSISSLLYGVAESIYEVLRDRLSEVENSRIEGRPCGRLFAVV